MKAGAFSESAGGAGSGPETRIRGQVTGRVRRLRGFLKSHHLPDGHHAAAEAFVGKVGSGEVKALADRIYGDLRKLFGYRRREFAYTCENGFAGIKTPDFELEIQIGQSPSEARDYCIRTEIVALRNQAMVEDERFLSCFNYHCDVLVVIFSGSMDLETIIDQLESIHELAECLDYAPDGSCIELKLGPLDLDVRIDNTGQMEIRLIRTRDLGKLLNHGQKVIDLMNQLVTTQESRWNRPDSQPPRINWAGW